MDSLIFESFEGVITKSNLSPGVEIILSTTIGSIAFPSVAMTVSSWFSICDGSKHSSQRRMESIDSVQK